MKKDIKEIADKVAALLKEEEVEFPWIFISEDLDDDIKIFSVISNIEHLPQSGMISDFRMKIKGIYRYLLRKGG
jgi:hypothetical protein